MTNQIDHLENCSGEKYQFIMASYQQKRQRYFFHSGLWWSRSWVIWTPSPAWCVTEKASDTILWILKYVKLLDDKNRLSQRCLALKVQDHWNLARDIKINWLLSLCSGIQTNFSNKNKIVVRVCHSKLSVNQLKAFFLLMDVDVYFANECIYTQMSQSFAFLLSFVMETFAIFFFW